MWFLWQQIWKKTVILEHPDKCLVLLVLDFGGVDSKVVDFKRKLFRVDRLRRGWVTCSSMSSSGSSKSGRAEGSSSPLVGLASLSSIFLLLASCTNWLVGCCSSCLAVTMALSPALMSSKTWLIPGWMTCSSISSSKSHKSGRFEGCSSCLVATEKLFFQSQSLTSWTTWPVRGTTFWTKAKKYP